MKVYYVANARMPTEKAHGIQIAKMCEAFIEAGVDLTLVVPTRKSVGQSVKDFYDLRVEVPLKRLPTPDFYLYGTLGYRVSSCIFMFESLIFLWWKKLRGEKFIVYTVDLDNFSSSALPLTGMPLFSEMHGGKPDTFMQRFLFRHVQGIIAINSIIVEELRKKFPFSLARYAVEPNGVDPTHFHPIDKKEARQKIGLPLEGKIALYTGRFFDWKGLEILPQAAKLTPDITWHLVGGDKRHFEEFVSESVPENFNFVGSRPHQEMSWWFAAADALIVLGTKRDTQSYYWTSPMKLFEYLLSQRPIVASKTPAIEQIVSEREVLLYEPDNAADLAKKVQEAVEAGGAVISKLSRAEEKGRHFSWQARAERVKRDILEPKNK